MHTFLCCSCISPYGAPHHSIQFTWNIESKNKNTIQNQFFATPSFFVLIMEREKLNIQDNQWQLKKTLHLLA